MEQTVRHAIIGVVKGSGEKVVLGYAWKDCFFGQLEDGSEFFVRAGPNNRSMIRGGEALVDQDVAQALENCFRYQLNETAVFRKRLSELNCQTGDGIRPVVPDMATDGDDPSLSAEASIKEPSGLWQ